MTCITLMRYQQKQQKDYQINQKKVEIKEDKSYDRNSSTNIWNGVRSNNTILYGMDTRQLHYRRYKKQTMSGTFIIIVVMVITVILGKYALAEGQRIERQKKFNKNLINTNNMWTTTTTFGDYPFTYIIK